MIGGGFGGVGRVSANRPDPKLGVIVHRKVGLRVRRPHVKKGGFINDPADAILNYRKTGTIGIRWTSSFMDGSGYAEASRNYLAALHTAGVQVNACAVSFEEARSDYGRAGAIAKGMINNEVSYAINVVHLTPENYPQHIKEGCYNIGFFAWETNIIPSKWVYECNAMDEIWVPCKWTAEVTRKAGVKKPIHVFGHCVCPEEYRNVHPMKLPELSHNWFKFYSIFQWTERKNPAGLLRAYLTSFRKKDPVVLILKTYRSNYSKEEQSAVLDQIQSIKKDVGGSKQPKILVILDMLTRQEMLSLHAMGDCFVLLHRSEGWGLPHFEACAMGKPVITTGYGGNLEFTNADNSFLVGYKTIPVERMGWIPWYNDEMSWADPDIKECSKYMRYVYSNRGMANARAQKARNLLFCKFGWESIGNEIKNRLAEITKELRTK